MSSAAEKAFRTPLRGSCLLLAHCRGVERLMKPGGRPAQERLEGLVGPDLAGILVRGLAGDHRLRPALDRL